jgi:hypothetical protein
MKLFTSYLKETKVKKLLATVLTLGLLSTSAFAATEPQAKMPISLTCKGVLVHDDSKYHLNPDAGSSLWCDADISEEFGLKASVSRVLDNLSRVVLHEDEDATGRVVLHDLHSEDGCATPTREQSAWHTVQIYRRCRLNPKG